MYKTRDPVYLPETRIDMKDSSSLYSYLADRFHIDTGETDNALRCSILILCYLCQYISREEMSFFLGSYFSSSAIRRMLGRMCDEHLLRKDRFAEQDSYSRYAYCLTRKSIDLAASFFPLESRQAVKERRSGGIVPEHDYSAGINMLHFLASPFSFLWKREYTYGGLYKVKRSLCVDYAVSVKDGRCIYLEQDMGTEAVGRVIEKISIYGDHGLTADGNNCLVFSMRHVPHPAGKESVFNPGFAGSVLSGMREKNTRSLYDYYTQYVRYDGDGAAAGKIRQLLCTTGVCEPVPDTGTDGGDMDIRRIKNHDFTLRDMERYCDDLRNMDNPYRTISMNRQQVLSAFRKEMSMTDVLIGYMQNGHSDRDSVRALLGGFQCYVLPTALLGNYFKIIMPSGYARIPAYRASIDGYYKVEGDFMEKGPVIAAEGFPALYLKNVFPAAGGGYVCITSVFSLTGIIQAYFLANVPLPFPVHFIFLCDTAEQAFQTAEKTGCLTESAYVEMTGNSFHAYFLLTADVGKPDRLKAVCRYDYKNGPEYELFSVKPADQKIDTTGAVSLADLAAKLFGDEE